MGKHSTSSPLAAMPGILKSYSQFKFYTVEAKNHSFLLFQDWLLETHPPISTRKGADNKFLKDLWLTCRKWLENAKMLSVGQ
jgi:hypothetical protein